VRENIASYYTQITKMDAMAGGILNQLKEDELMDNTIVFFFSDHGAGLPRGKRWLHKSGTHVPMILYCPEQYEHLLPDGIESKNDRLVSFVDFAPTVLSLANVEIPSFMQGIPFLGNATQSPRDYIYSTRDRVGENIVCGRTVTDGDFQYIRNFLPHRPRMPFNEYSELTPIRAELRRLDSMGILSQTERWLLEPSIPTEEFYDLSKDPHQINNLISDKTYEKQILKMRNLLYDKMCANTHPNPYEFIQKMEEADYKEILKTMQMVGMGVEYKVELSKLLSSHESFAVRYWAAVGLGVLKEKAVSEKDALLYALKDESMSVQIAVAEALCYIGQEEAAIPVLMNILQTGTQEEVLEATTVLLMTGLQLSSFAEELQLTMERDFKEVNKQIRYILSHL